MRICQYRCSIIVLAATAMTLSSCTYLNDEIHNTDAALTYGFNPEELTPKVDEKPDYYKKKHKVNAYMWRASLRAMNAFPLSTSDMQTGIIVTDWYAAPENPDDRRQITVKILGDDIRRDMLRVSVARQVRQEGEWQDVAAYAGVAQSYEDNILKDAVNIRGW